MPKLTLVTSDYVQRNHSEIESKTVMPKADAMFAKQVLAALGIMYIVAITAYALYPSNTALKEVFEFIKIGALPILTLVVTLYFSNNARR